LLSSTRVSRNPYREIVKALLRDRLDGAEVTVMGDLPLKAASS